MIFLRFLRLFIFTVLLSISLSNHIVLGSSTKIRAKRLSNSESDTNNLFKHEARLTTQDGMCTGTIIADKFVLTAAHCVIVKGTRNLVNIDRQVMEVTVAITKVNELYEFQTVRLVEAIYLPKLFFNPPNFNDNLRDMTDDIAVLKLNYKLGLGLDPRIEALNLPMQTNQNYVNSDKKHIVFAGFGGTRAVYNMNLDDHEPGDFPMFLHYSLAKVLPPNECPLLGNPEIKMCASLVNTGAGICGGDSGGALINFEEKTILGVLSHGAKMCNQELPGVYTRVSSYLRFIFHSMYDVPDKDIRRESFVENRFYQEVFLRNRYMYHWIYVPELMKN